MEKHNAVVMGAIVGKRYSFAKYFGSAYIREYEDLIKNKQIWEGELENPPLEINDYLYIKDENIKVKITDKAKSTEGGYVYWTDHVIETIEDEKTNESKLEAEETLNKYVQNLKDKQEERQKENNQDGVIIKKIDKKWWEFWK